MDKASNSFEKSQSFLISPVDTTAGLTVALAVPTQLSTATPSLSSAFTPAPIPATANNDDTEVLGTKTTRTPLTDTAAIAASPEGWKFFGVAWYWLLIALAAISGLWWLAAARRRVAEDV